MDDVADQHMPMFEERYDGFNNASVARFIREALSILMYHAADAAASDDLFNQP